MVLDEQWNVESLTPGAEGWLAELPDGDWAGRQKLPPAVLAVAGRALRTAEGDTAPGEVALARVLSTEGRWILLHGAGHAGAVPGSTPGDASCSGTEGAAKGEPGC